MLKGSMGTDRRNGKVESDGLPRVIQLRAVFSQFYILSKNIFSVLGVR